MKNPYKTLFTFVQIGLYVAVCALSGWAQNLTFQIVSYDCHSGVLQYKFSSSDNAQVSVTLPGIFGGMMNPNTVASYTFPGDGLTGRTVTGTASQSGSQISINFTNSCSLGPTTPPSNPPTGGGSGNGLAASYFNNTDLSGSPALTRTDATVNFTWSDANSPFPGVSSTNMSARWEGQVEAPVSGNYTFSSNNDDATRLWVNGQQLVNDWPAGHAPQLLSGTISLQAGQKYSIKMEFYQGGGGAQAQLLWAYPGQAQQIIPQGRLYSSGTTPPSNPPTGACSVSNPAAYFDEATCGMVRGWALDQANLNQPVTIDVYVDGVKTYSGITANGDRPDLVSYFNNPAARYHGFSYTFPADASWKNGQNHSFSVRICGTNSDMAGGPKAVNSCTGGGNPPANPPTGGGSGSGLVGSYYNNTGLSGSPALTRTDATINFNWGNGSPDGSISSDNFSVRWVGQVEAPFTGTYTFRTNNDDGTRLWVNNQQLIDDWNGHAPTLKEGTISLTQGQKYDIRMEYFESIGGAQAQLFWVPGAGQSQEIVPQNRLYSNSTGSTRPNGAQVGRILYPGDPNLNVNWDWTQGQYKIWYKSGGIKSEFVANPFNSNVPSIVVKGDQYTQDGWMLVARDFGISPEDASAIRANSDAVVLPFFILYNKYTGKLRVFIYNPSERNEFTHHSVSLSLAGNNGLIAPAILAFGSSDSTQLYDNQHNSKLTQNVLTPAAPTGWSVADFDLSFFDYRIEYTSQYDDWSLIISIDDITISKSVSTGNIVLDGTVQPQANGFFKDATKSVNDFKVNGLSEVKTLVSALTKGAEKGIEIGVAASSGLGLIVAASDLIDGLTGSSQGYDIKLNGTFNLSGITTSSVGGYSYAIPLKRRASRPTDNNYYPLQDIPWGIIGLSQLSTLDVRGLSYDIYHPGCISTETGQITGIDCSDYHANGVAINPVLPSALANRNGLKLISIQATYFKPDLSPDLPYPSYTGTQHAFPFEYGRYKDGNYVSSPDFESKEFIIKGTRYPFNKVGILFTFQPINPTIKITEPITIYRVFALNTAIRYVNNSVIHTNTRLGTSDQNIKNPYPNPFERVINLPLTSLKIGSHYKVQIISLDGKVVWETVGVVSGEVQDIQWNGQDLNHSRLNSGIYISKTFEEGLEVATHKITLIK